jgi:hypothetical protein
MEVLRTGQMLEADGRCSIGGRTDSRKRAVLANSRRKNHRLIMSDNSQKRKRSNVRFPGKTEDEEEKKLEGKRSTIHVPVRYELSPNKCHLEIIPSRNRTRD